MNWNWSLLFTLFFTIHKVSNSRIYIRSTILCIYVDRKYFCFFWNIGEMINTGFRNTIIPMHTKIKELYEECQNDSRSLWQKTGLAKIWQKSSAHFFFAKDVFPFLKVLPYWYSLLTCFAILDFSIDFLHLIVGIEYYWVLKYSFFLKGNVHFLITEFYSYHNTYLSPCTFSYSCTFFYH